HLAGEVFTEAQPAADPALYGTVSLHPLGRFEVRSFASFTLTYRCGRFGLDDTGSLRIALRFTADGGPLQMDDPTAPNYVTARTSKGVALRLAFDANGNPRPWYQALTLTVSKGYLGEGDSIVVVIGDRSGGSPGYRLQSFCESRFTFRTLVDVCATGHFVPLQDSPSIAVVPGLPAFWKAVLPTQRRPGEPFRLGIKAEDAWGNPSDQVDETLTLAADTAVEGLPRTLRFPPGKRALSVDNLLCRQEGTLRISVLDSAGRLLAISNPLVVRTGTTAGFWGDMHGQSGESVGVNSAEDYLNFARDLAFLDAASHQANDFQINNAFWAQLNELSAAFHEDGRFLTLPGYEWSGNTGVGGDRNVYFRSEGRPLRRSSHALVADRSDIGSDATTARELFAALAPEDCVVYAHVGGRPADVAYAHDPRLETAMEIHSDWGTFEWLLGDCFRLGYRVGVVANSDGHKGRPGASFPGASEFGAYGGLTCFLMDRLTRDDLFACLKRRRHYATTGNRLFLDLAVSAASPFAWFAQDPQLGVQTPSDRAVLRMGDIAQSRAAEVWLDYEVKSASGLLSVELLNAMKVVDRHLGYAAEALGSRVRVLWQGALTKGRGARARWEGKARFEGARLRRLQQINGWNPDRPLFRPEPETVAWEAVTCGNFNAFDAWLDESADARLAIDTNFGGAQLRLAELGLEPRR
ncbi:MAG TPA: hypothetical protein VJL84_05020, partial [Kiloniellales bacterium]|nr:hypothetical protein [Kiloniellales bacterium]